MSNLLDNSRNKINKIDEKLANLFKERMEVVNGIAQYKKENNLPILVAGREREIIYSVTKDMDDQMAEYTKILYTTMFDLSKAYQEHTVVGVHPLQTKITNTILNTNKTFPKSAIVACQGIEGANSSTACDKIFSRASITYFNDFEGVFKAVDQGLCDYGILPIENSLHGSVTGVYDLMSKYDFQIVRSVKVKIQHTLLAKKGTDIKNVKEIYSHPQALAQCNDFFKEHKSFSPCNYANTGMAAEMVANSNRDDIAAIADEGCAQLYNLEIIKSDIQNSDNNHTRFICISKKAEIYPGADKVSLMFTISHQPGSLYNIISKFSAIGVNMSKLESRPIPGKDFEFMFYVDFDADITEVNIQKLITQIQSNCKKFSYLGSYKEV